MIDLVLNFFMSAAAAYVGGTLVGVFVMMMLYYIYATMGLKYFLLALGGVLVVVTLVLVIYLIYRLVVKKKSDQMEQALTQDAMAKKQQRQQAKMAVQDIRDRWGEALTTLKATKVKIYDLPWLLLIGEPQSGKTTTLRESGLDFPLGKDSLSGSGGTVNCDWWFTNDAVILDTAGRFTMPVDSAPDKEEWHAFLKLLTRYRPRCPINGVIVTIPATSLLEDRPETIKEKSHQIREKLHELVAVLGIEFPVYIMVSKLDLVYGFAEFCASLANEERRQVLGWNRKILVSQPFDQNEYTTFFAALAARLQAWALRRLRDMPGSAEADRVYAFPGEFNRLKDTLAAYLANIFRQDRYSSPLLLRGCYFSSGLQEGRSIARALLEGAEGADRSLMAEFAKSFVQSRAYFINLFYKKAFRERFLVKRAGGATRQEIMLRVGAAAFALIFILGATFFLISGYRNLAKTVRPLEEHSKKAQTMLLTEGSQANLSEIISVFTTLENGRQQLIKSGAKRFLRGRENVLVTDLALIEDALIERKLLTILFGEAGKGFANQRITTMEEKERLYTALIDYIEVIAGGEISPKSLAHLLDLPSWNGQAPVDASRAEVETILAGYPYSGKKGRIPKRFADSAFHLRQAMSGLYTFWDSFYAQLWQTQKTSLAAINAAYGELITVSPAFTQPENAEAFTRQGKGFIEIVDAFTSGGQKLVWTQALRDKCTADYRLMQDKLTDAGIPDITAMAATAQRHGGVCTQLEQGVGTQWSAALEENKHIMLADGTISPELPAVRDAVDKVAKFGPLFTPEMRERIKTELDNPITVLDAWYGAWQAAKAEKLKEITAITDKATSDKWRKKELLALLEGYLNQQVLLADSEAVSAALRALSMTDAKVEGPLLRGMDPPKSVRAAYLVGRFKTYQKLKDWLQAKHAGSPALVPIRESLSEIMITSYRNCLKYWTETLKAGSGKADVMAARDWKSFRSEVIKSKGSFIDVGAYPLGPFLENMAFKDFQELKGLVGEAVSASALSGVKPLEQQVDRTAMVFGSPRNLPQLDEAQSTFLGTIDNLGDDSAKAWQTLQKGKAGDKSGGPSMDSLKALGDLQRRLDRDATTRGEPFVQRLGEVESHALSLLRKNVSGNFEADWGGFFGNWQNKLGNKFPFGSRDNWLTLDSLNANTRALAFKVEDKNELYDFFFTPDKGFEAFVKQYNLLNVTPGENEAAFFLGESQKSFIGRCIAWRNFLFDKDGKIKKHKVQITIDEGRKLSEIDSSKFFTQLYFTGLGTEKDKSLLLRFSGQKYKGGVAIWDLDSAPEVTVEAKNEETGAATKLVISGGSLAFPTYVATEGTREGTIRSSDWRLDMRVPKVVQFSADQSRMPDIAKAGYFLVPLSVSWDEPLPDPIGWPLR